MTRRFQNPEWEEVLRDHGFTCISFHDDVRTPKSVEGSVLPPAGKGVQPFIFVYSSLEFPGISVTFQRIADVFICVNSKESPSRLRTRLSIIAMKRVFGL